MILHWGGVNVIASNSIHIHSWGSPLEGGSLMSRVSIKDRPNIVGYSPQHFKYLPQIFNLEWKSVVCTHSRGLCLKNFTQFSQSMHLSHVARKYFPTFLMAWIPCYSFWWRLWLSCFGIVYWICILWHLFSSGPGRRWVILQQQQHLLIHLRLWRRVIHARGFGIWSIHTWTPRYESNLRVQ